MKELKSKIFECSLLGYSDAAEERGIVTEMDTVGEDYFVVICENKKQAVAFCQERLEAKEGNWFLNGLHESYYKRIFIEED